MQRLYSEQHLRVRWLAIFPLVNKLRRVLLTKAKPYFFHILIAQKLVNVVIQVQG